MKTIIKWDFPLFLQVLKDKLIIILILSAIVSGCGTVISSYMRKPVYTSDAVLSQNDNNISQIDTYSQFIKTSKFQSLLDKKNKKSLKTDYKYNLSLVSDGKSAFFTLRVTGSNPRYSQIVVNNAMEVFMGNASKYFAGTNVTIVSKASLNNKPDIINFKKTTLSIFIIVFIASYLIALFRYILSGKMRDTQFIRDVYGYEKLGELELKGTKN